MVLERGVPLGALSSPTAAGPPIGDPAGARSPMDHQVLRWPEAGWQGAAARASPAPGRGHTRLSGPDRSSGAGTTCSLGGDDHCAASDCCHGRCTCCHGIGSGVLASASADDAIGAVCDRSQFRHSCGHLQEPLTPRARLGSSTAAVAGPRRFLHAPHAGRVLAGPWELTELCAAASAALSHVRGRSKPPPQPTALAGSRVGACACALARALVLGWPTVWRVLRWREPAELP
mmetsp:Transcript_104951/g.234220  ORF Transcript_104951/g.234220 Transcript_104951/m.234220 type:complete len:232 (-) Transcript_104951:106-801(-)